MNAAEPICRWLRQEPGVAAYLHQMIKDASVHPDAETGSDAREGERQLARCVTDFVRENRSLALLAQLGGNRGRLAILKDSLFAGWSESVRWDTVQEELNTLQKGSES